MTKALCSLLVIILTGCAASSRIKLTDTNKAPLARSQEPVCLLKSPMPSDIAYTSIGEMVTGKKFYGSTSELIPVFAEQARAVGADAVINMQMRQKIGALAWQHPVGSGTAIKLADKGSFDCMAHGGEYR